MKNTKLGTVESHFADLVWENEPLTTSELIKICEKELKIAALSPFENIEGIREIPESLSDVKGLNWLWIDVLIYAPIHYIRTGSSYNVEKIGNEMSTFEERIFADCRIPK